MEIWIFGYKIVPWSASSEDQIDEELKSEILTAAASVSAVWRPRRPAIGNLNSEPDPAHSSKNIWHHDKRADCGLQDTAVIFQFPRISPRPGHFLLST